MWILKNSKELLENLKAQSLHSVNSINSFDFSTLYTTIPHDKLKSKLKTIINQCFFHKNGNRRFQYAVIGYKDTYSVWDHSDAPQKYSDADVSNIPSAPAYGVYVSHFIRYARTCSNYQDFMERGKVLTTKLLSQGYQKTKLVATLKKFYGRHHDLVNPYNVAVSKIVSDVFASDAP